MAFDEQFLDSLRAQVRVSDFVGKRVKLKKVGQEHVGLSPFNKENTPSFTVNDRKGGWFDFSSGKNGDVFGFLMQVDGLSFPEAVKEVCREAGVEYPSSASKPNGVSSSQSEANRSTEPPPDYDQGIPPIGLEDVPGADGGRAPDIKKSGREITATYDYCDPQGTLIYQVCRMEWSDNGRKRKTFMQRRPTPEKDGHWIWGLGTGDFLQSRNGDWYQATDERIEKWKDAPQRTIKDAAQHGLYALVEFVEERSPEVPVYLTEGEKDTDTLRSWDLTATTNSGGARHWTPELAQYFTGLDVVIAIDNDEAGKDRADIVGHTLRGVAARVRVLNIADHWPGGTPWPPGHLDGKGIDVTDWRDNAAGSPGALRGLLPALPEWQPKPFVSKFGGITFEQLDDPGPEHEFLIDDFLTIGDKSIIGGASKSGKSFLAIDAAMAIALGTEFHGHKILAPGLVVYQAGEGARAIKKRFRAYRQYYGISKEQAKKIPVYIMQSKVDLYAAPGDTTAFIEELSGVQRLYNEPLRALFIDTLAKAQGGADENSGKDMAAVMSNIDKIAATVPGCHVCLVHHFNAAGTKLRGHSSIYANIDQVILVTKDEDSPVRTATLDKQKDGEDGLSLKFELYVVELGRRVGDGKPITSCVTLRAGGNSLEVRDDKRGRSTIRLTAARGVIMRALKNALASEDGEETPSTLKLPASITRVVRKKFWKQHYIQIAPDMSPVPDNTINKRMADALAQFMELRLVGNLDPYVWLTGRAVAGIVEVEPRIQQPTDGSVSEKSDIYDDAFG